MTWFLLWALVGALLGVAAAQRNGFSAAGGILGGLLLGPLSILMFMLNGVGGGNAGRRKCPHCAQWIKSDAVVCTHCRRAVLFTDVSRGGRCRHCGGAVPLRARACPVCQRRVQTDHRSGSRVAVAS